jgi:TolB-like protein/class 3 adenylate cyclase
MRKPSHGTVNETRKLAAILVSDVVGYSRLAGTDEDRILARLRTLRSDLMDPTIAVHHGRIVKRTGDGSIIEFRSVVDAVNCAIEVQRAMVDRNAEVALDKRIELRIGIHLGDVVEEGDGDLMGDGVNIAARIEGIANPGAICLSEDAYRQVKGRLDLKVNDLGLTQLKNIAEPIRLYSVEVGQPVPAKPGPQSSAAERNFPPHLSLVVLPFANIGRDPGQEYFVDGVTESLTTDLSQMSGMLVIGRNTAFSYKNKPVDLKQIGRELNVRYVLEGSVQRSADRMRVNVQLIDAESGNHLWAERFDKPVADLFDMQDEIVARLTNALNAQLIAAEAHRADRAPHPDSMDLYFQGMACFHRGVTAENTWQARQLFERALLLDPSNVEALVGGAAVDALVAATFFSAADRVERFAVAENSLTKALALAPQHAFAHLWLGLTFNFTHRAAQAIAKFDRALAINPNLAMAHAFIGHTKLLIGRCEDTEGHICVALRLSPLDTFSFGWLAIVGYSKLHLGLDEEAVVWLQRSIDTNRNFSPSHLNLAAGLAHLGRLKEGRAAVRAGLDLEPSFTIARCRASLPSDNALYLAQFERIFDGMRKVGVPEG